MFVDFNILNQLGSPSINSNTFANRPAAGQTGRLFVSTDTFEIYRDNGTSWDLIGGPGAGTITGTGTATQVAYFTGSQTIGSSANLFWDNTAGSLGINTATPGAELDVHGTGTIVQVNATGATSNAYLAFQRTGTGVWRIGDTYNGGSNFFELHNTVLTIDALEFEAATNKSTFLGQQTYASGLATGNQFTYNLTVPNGVNITSPNAVHAVNSYLNLSLGGNTTVPAGARQGLEGNSRISFTGAGTLTMTQGSTVRAFSALSSVYSFNGSAVGTVTHLAGLRICFPDNIGSAINITNNYGLLLNDQTAGLGTVTYTNRWGIYQEGASDINYFNGSMLLGSTTNSGQRLQVTGTALFTGSVTGTGNSSTYTVTASGALAASKSITSTLVASANNDVLAGLSIAPTFNAGAFTGVVPLAIRTIGAIAVTGTAGNTYAGAFTANAANTNALQIRGATNDTTTNAIIIAQLSNDTTAFIRSNGETTIGRNGSTVQPLTLNSSVGNNILNLNTNILKLPEFALCASPAGNEQAWRLYNNNRNGFGMIMTYNNVQQSNTVGTGHIALGGTLQNQGSFDNRVLQIAPTYNFDASTTASAIALGIFYNPTLTNLRLAQHRAIQTVTGDVLFGTTSGSTGIGATTTINASAILQVTSTTQGFLPPRMTTAQKNAIAAPAAGLTIYDTTLNKLCVFTGVNWETVTSV